MLSVDAFCVIFQNMRLSNYDAANNTSEPSRTSGIDYPSSYKETPIQEAKLVDG